jgi:hypothetical protein
MLKSESVLLSSRQITPIAERCLQEGIGSHYVRMNEVTRPSIDHHGSLRQDARPRRADRLEEVPHFQPSAMSARANAYRGSQETGASESRLPA